MSFLDRLHIHKKLKESAKNFQVAIPVYSVYDKKAQSYSPPFLASRHTVAIRMVTASCSDPNSIVRMYPNDYRLDQIGFFCEATGVLSSLEEKEIVMEMSNILGELSMTGEDANARDD